MALPTVPKEVEQDITKYTLLLYGREKIGKTTMAASFPGAIFLSTEPGTKGLRVFEFNADDGGVKNWDIMRKAIDLLIEVKGGSKFKTVVIDTVDRAYDMCLDWVCENRGIEYPGVDDEGDEDFGKSWRAVKMEFLEQMHRLVQAGYGLVLTSHAKEQTFKTKSGDKFTRIFPSMGNQARNIVEAMVDLFFFADYMRDQKTGETRRILICGGDDTIWAGARQTLAGAFPKFIPMLEKGGYDMLLKTFKGEYKGISAADIMPARITAQTTKDFILREKTKSSRAITATPIKKG